MNSKHFIALLAAAFVAVPGVASAQMTAGEIEYQQACASCHGASGKGDGPVSAYMNVKVPDLTKIASSEEGNFPFQKLMEMIDGRNSERQIKAHGSPMPVWGDRFMVESGSADNIQNEINTLGRITSLVYYLERMQE